MTLALRPAPSPAPARRGRHRVLFVIPALSQGGAERQILELVRRLDRDEFEPSLLTFYDDGHYTELLADGVPHVTLALPPGRFGVAGYGALVAALRNARADLVQSYMDQANLWVRLAAPRAGVPRVVTSVRGPWMRWRYLALEGFLSERVGEAVVVNSRCTYEEMVGRARVPLDRLRIIPNFVDFDRFRPATAREREEARRKLGLAEDELALLLPGRISPQKNQLGLALALGRLRAAGRLPAHVRILFAGRPRDAWYARLVPPALRAARVERFVRGLGTVAANDMTSLYAGCDALLLPSLWEGLPNVALEAHACGLPALVSDRANVDGIVEHGVTGFVAPLEPAMGAIADAITDLAALSPAERAAMGARGRARVRAMFPPERVLDAYLRLYRDALSQPPRRRAA